MAPPSGPVFYYIEAGLQVVNSNDNGYATFNRSTAYNTFNGVNLPEGTNKSFIRARKI